MPYLKGKFVNANGLEDRSWYVRISQPKIWDFKQAAEIAKKSFLVLASDRHRYLRLFNVEKHLYKRLPEGEYLAGDFFNTIRTESGSPLSVFELVQKVPNELKDEVVAEIAAVHVASDLGVVLNHPHRLPK